MDRDVGWSRIVIAVLIGCAVFATAKFAVGFAISIQDVIGIVISLAVVFGMAALILVLRDKVTLKPNMPTRRARRDNQKSSNRFNRGWAIALFIMAIIALPLHAFRLIDEPLWQRLLFLAMAALIIISFFLSWQASRNQEEPGDRESASTAEDKRRWKKRFWRNIRVIPKIALGDFNSLLEFPTRHTPHPWNPLTPWKTAESSEGRATLESSFS
jgi:hypothetical protein